jgi:hypothetical protein
MYRVKRQGKNTIWGELADASRHIDHHTDEASAGLDHGCPVAA